MPLANFLRAPNKQPVILLDWQLGCELSKLTPRNSDTFSWNKAPVINGVTYYRTYQYQPDTRILGVRREIVRVTFAGMTMTKRNSAPLVDSNAGSWAWDGTNVYISAPVNQPLDTVFWYDNGTGNYGDETVDAASETTADISIHANVNDIMYFGMASSKFEYIKLLFSTAPVKAPTSTRSYEYWNGATWAALTVTAITGDTNWDGDTTVELRWTVPADWVTTATVGNATVGTPARYWMRSKVNTANYTTAGVGSQFLTAPVPNENIIVAWANLPLANQPIYINSDYYQPRLIVNQQTSEAVITSENTEAIQKAMVGTAVTSAGGSIVISNGDGALDKAAADYQIIGGQASLFIGFNSNSFTAKYADYTQFRTAVIEGMTVTDSIIELATINQTQKMDAQLIQSFITSADYSTMDRSQDGAPAPLFFGNTETLAPSPDSTQDKWNRCLPGVKIKQGTASGTGYINQRWKFAGKLINPETGISHTFGAGPAGTTIGPAAVMRLRAGKASDIATGNWEALENGSVIGFKNGYVAEDGDDYRIRTLGFRDDNSGTFTGTATTRPVIAKPNDIAHCILICLCGYSTSELNLATFTQSGTTKQGVAGTLIIDSTINDNSAVYISSTNESGRTVIARLCNQIDGVCQPDASGKMALAVFSTEPANTDVVLLRHQTSGWKQVWNTDMMVDQLVYKYAQHPSGSWRTITGSQLTTVGALNVIDRPATAFSGIKNIITIESYGYTDANATVRAKQLYDRYKRGRIQYFMDDKTGMTLASLLGDRVFITRSRMIGGSQTEKKTWLLTACKQWGSASVTIEAMEAS